MLQAFGYMLFSRIPSMDESTHSNSTMYTTCFEELPTANNDLDELFHSFKNEFINESFESSGNEDIMDLASPSAASPVIKIESSTSTKISLNHTESAPALILPVIPSSPEIQLKLCHAVITEESYREPCIVTERDGVTSVTHDEYAKSNGSTPHELTPIMDPKVKTAKSEAIHTPALQLHTPLMPQEATIYVPDAIDGDEIINQPGALPTQAESEESECWEEVQLLDWDQRNHVPVTPMVDQVQPILNQPGGSAGSRMHKQAFYENSRLLHCWSCLLNVGYLIKICDCAIYQSLVHINCLETEVNRWKRLRCRECGAMYPVKSKPNALRKIRRRPSFIMSIVVIIMGILFLAMKNEHPAAITFGVFIFSMGFILALGNYLFLRFNTRRHPYQFDWKLIQLPLENTLIYAPNYSPLVECRWCKSGTPWLVKVCDCPTKDAFMHLICVKEQANENGSSKCFTCLNYLPVDEPSNAVVARRAGVLVLSLGLILLALSVGLFMFELVAFSAMAFGIAGCLVVIGIVVLIYARVTWSNLVHFEIDERKLRGAKRKIMQNMDIDEEPVVE